METKKNMNKNSPTSLLVSFVIDLLKRKLNYTIDAQHLRSETKKDKPIKMNFACESLLGLC